LASFNPQVPDINDPNYLSYSKGTSTPELKSSEAVLLKGVGDLIEGGAKSALAIGTTIAENEAEKGARGIRDKYISDLETLNPLTNQAAPRPQIPTEANALSPTGMNILDTRQPANQSLERDLTKVGSLVGGRDSGKVSDTYYRGELVRLTKDLRNKYPFAADEVSARVAKISGGDPANQMIASMQNDINSYLTNQQAIRNKVVSQFFEKNIIGYTGADVQVMRLMNGGPIEPAIKYLAGAQQTAAVLDQKKVEWELDKGSDEDKQRKWTQDLEGNSGKIQRQVWEGVGATMGIQSPKELAQIAADYYSGNRKLPSGIQAHELGQLALKWKQDYINMMYASITPAVSASLGTKKIRDVIDEGAKRFDDIADKFNNEKTGAAFDAINKNKFFAAGAEFGLRTDPNIGAAALATEAARKVMGDGLISDRLQRDAYKNFGTSGTPEGDAETSRFITNIRNSTMNQGDLRFKPVFDNFSKGVNELANNNKIPDKVRTKTFDTLFDDIDDIANNPNMSVDAKRKTANYIFNPANGGWDWLKNIKPDEVVVGRDNVGRVVSGQQSLFNRFTRPGFAEQMAVLGGQEHQHYVDWVNTTASQDLIRQDLMKFNSMNLGGEDNPYRVIYNPTTHQMDVVVNNQSAVNMARRWTGQRGGVVPQVGDTVARMNKVFDGVANVAESQGKNPNAAVLDMVINSVGGAETLKKLPGVPQDIINSILASQKKQEETQKTREQRRKKEELLYR
jgi:hypothetical protein